MSFGFLKEPCFQRRCAIIFAVPLKLPYWMRQISYVGLTAFEGPSGYRSNSMHSLSGPYTPIQLFSRHSPGANTMVIKIVIVIIRVARILATVMVITGLVSHGYCQDIRPDSHCQQRLDLDNLRAKSPRRRRRGGGLIFLASNGGSRA